MDLQVIQDWIFSFGDEYGVNPIVFAVVYFGGLPFLGLSIAWLIRNRRRSQPVHFPLLSAAAFSMAAYVYVIIAGENIPIWVYGIVAAFVVVGSWKVFHIATCHSEA